MAWIKLSIHPEHDKVLTLADLLNCEADRVFVAAVRWFRWVDQEAESADISISYAGFRAVTRWPDDSLARAMQHDRVQWLQTVNDGRLGPTKFESHMSSGAKIRAQDQKRKASKGVDPESVRKVSAKCPEKSGQKTEPEKEKELEKDNQSEQVTLRITPSLTREDCAQRAFVLTDCQSPQAEAAPESPALPLDSIRRVADIIGVLEGAGVNEPALTVLAEADGITVDACRQVIARVRAQASRENSKIVNPGGVIVKELAKRFGVELPRANPVVAELKKKGFDESVIRIAQIRQRRNG